MQGTVTLTMIVRNEAANLEACLNSVAGQVDEIIIVDTGSTDNTREIARRYTDKLYNYAWNGDFSTARNFALEQATSEWILYLDADEQLAAGTGLVKDLITGNNQDKQVEAFLLPLNNPTSDSTGQYNRFLVLRLFKNNGRYRFRGNIHEQVVITENNVVDIAPGPVIKHKIITGKERNRKRGRNLALLKKACTGDRENPFLQYYLGVEWMMLGKPQQALPHLRHAYRELTDINLLFRSPALRYLVICLHALGKIDEAISLCREAAERYPDYTDIYYLGGVLLEEKQEYQTAIEQFNRAVKCGTPPALYSHMHGTDSFLAYYHLGHCHEMLGKTGVARDYYKQALDINPGHTYPVYNLFPLLLAKYGPVSTLAYYRDKNFWKNIELAAISANLFYIAGYPHLACRCLEGWGINIPEEIRFYLGKYNIYSGRLEEGLEYLSKIPEGNLYPEAQIHRVIACLLLGRYPEGRSLALQLWKNPTTRCDTWLLLTLARMMEKGEPVNFPRRVRGTDILEPARKMYDFCSRYLPEARGQKNSHCSQLVNGLESIIKNTSHQGYLALLEYFKDKSLITRSLFDYKFGSGWNRI